MIVEAKKGRSIILTTHFLDEADVLSDRVGIIKDGALITCGTSLFLKHSFGVGYTLSYNAPTGITISVDDILCDAQEMPQEEGKTQFEWRLNHGSESKFPDVLELLQSSGASNIQLDLTTLEEVFLETGKEEIDESEGSEDDTGRNGTDDRDLEENADTNVESLGKIWASNCEKQSVTWWRKLVLVQHFMMGNAWKMKGVIFLNVAMPVSQTSSRMI